MKKVFLFLFPVLAIFAGCSKSQDNSVANVPSDCICASFTASMPQVATKAAIDNDGMAAYADRCRLQIIMKRGSSESLVYDETKSVDLISHTADFKDIILPKGNTFDIMFWADNTAGNYYDTQDLRTVKMLGDYVGNKDSRDAFFAAIADTTITDAFSRTIVLYRPFGQLNVITNDIPVIASQLPAGTSFDDVVPNEISIEVTAPDVFNVLTGAASGSKAFKYDAPVYTNPYKTEALALNTLSMDYFYAPALEQSVNAVTFKARNTQPTGTLTEIVHEFQNIPLQRNFRTNIQGALLTNKSDITVKIDPAWLQPDFTENK